MRDPTTTTLLATAPADTEHPPDIKWFAAVRVWSRVARQIVTALTEFPHPRSPNFPTPEQRLAP
jgi:hypothetical protein